jgi:phosphonate transport system substrate-binding protein
MSQVHQLRLVSYLAPNMFWFYQAVGAYLGRVFEVETQITQSQYDPLVDPMLLEDQVDVAFICGLPLMRYCQRVPAQLAVLVAPVMQASRYQNRPVYFSDIIVHASSDIKTFDDLGGKTFCYNDLGSNSGYNLMRQKLIQSGYLPSFFGKVIASGSHQRSIRWVAEGLADCSAIDSTVLEQELHDYPELQQLRVLESVGPCSMPPVVVAQRLGTALIHQIQLALLQPDAELQSVMNQARIQGYRAVEAADYAAIEEMYELAIASGYETLS